MRDGGGEVGTLFGGEEGWRGGLDGFCWNGSFLVFRLKIPSDFLLLFLSLSFFL